MNDQPDEALTGPIIFPCSLCQAEPGKPCVTTSGAPQVFHQAREQMAKGFEYGYKHDYVLLDTPDKVDEAYSKGRADEREALKTRVLTLLGLAEPEPKAETEGVMSVLARGFDEHLGQGAAS